MMTDQTHDKTASSSSDESRAHGWLHVLRARLGFAMPQSVRDALEGALRADASTSFTEAERKMLRTAFALRREPCRDVMVPRADIIALDENEPISELLKTFDEAGVSRIPLFRETLDDPRGMIHIKDLFRWLMSEATGQRVRIAELPTAQRETPAPKSARSS